jgi:Ser/Thr protein kinase RdoA (MazF antagonist)
MVDDILRQYGIDASKAQTEKFGTGLINHTWKITAQGRSYILQQVNQAVFTNPLAIDKNLSKLTGYFHTNYPAYLFVGPLPSVDGKTLLMLEGNYYRLFPFITDSRTLDVVTDKESAYLAARQFGLFSSLLNNFNTAALEVTLPDFHNLSLRYDQFTDAVAGAAAARLTQAGECIDFINSQMPVIESYRMLVAQKKLPLRVIHHDTKISNVLFDSAGKGLCVIDLDTVMPGYFISDIGDMMRTYLCTASEEEMDFDRIVIRKDFFKAIYDGYMEQMDQILNDIEKSNFIYAGKFIILMQAIRFLTDYLQNDIYYGKKYDLHNLNRAKNQITLLKRYLEMEPEFKVMLGLQN